MTPRTWWPNHPGANETWARVRDAMLRAGVKMRDVQEAATTAGAPAVPISTVIKTLHGGCATGDKGKAIRAAVAKLTKRSKQYLFGPADRRRK